MDVCHTASYVLMVPVTLLAGRDLQINGNNIPYMEQSHKNMHELKKLEKIHAQKWHIL